MAKLFFISEMDRNCYYNTHKGAPAPARSHPALQLQAHTMRGKGHVTNGYSRSETNQSCCGKAVHMSSTLSSVNKHNIRTVLSTLVRTPHKEA